MKASEQAKKARQSLEEHNYAGSGRMGLNYRSVASNNKGESFISNLNVTQHQAYINTLILLMKLHSQNIVESDTAGEIFAESLDVLTCEQLRLVKTSNSENHEIIQRATLNSKLEFEQNIIFPCPVSIPSTPIDSEMYEFDQDNFHSSTSSVLSVASLELTESANLKSSDPETTKISSLSDQQLKLFIKNVKQNEEFRSLSKTKKSSVIEEISKSKTIPELIINQPNSSNRYPMKIQLQHSQQKDLIIREKEFSETDPNNYTKLFAQNPQMKGFLVYYDEVIEEVKTSYPDMETEELIFNVKQMWSGLGQEDQQIYQAKTKDEIRKLSVLGDKEFDKMLNKAKVKVSPAGDKIPKRESPTNNKKDSIQDTVQNIKRFKFEKPDCSTSTRPSSKSSSEECQNANCSKKSKYDEFRGPRYCSSECCIKHCKSAFAQWNEQKKT